MDWTGLRVLFLDVDGVLTDGQVTMSADSDALRIFYVQDGYAIKLWQRLGGEVAILSGRQSAAVLRRAEELGITAVRQGVNDKLEAYRALCSELGAKDDEACFVGDDLPDLPVLERCAFPVAPGNAVAAVKRVVHYVTRREGGQGAVAEVIELILRKQGRWNRAMLIPPA